MCSLNRFLRFILNVQGAVIQNAEIDVAADAVKIHIRRHRNAKPRCPQCRKPMTGALQERRREWRHLDIFGTATFLVATIREGFCTRHGRRVERVPWAAPAARFTRPFDQQVAAIAKVADKTAASGMFAIDWTTVRSMVERVVATFLPKGRFANVHYIGVDETSYKRSHRYVTIVTDLLRRRVIWVGEGKSADTLSSFFSELGPRRCKRIQMVAMDMSASYQKSVRDNLPNADIVFDRFHVMKLLLEAIDEIRRDEVRKLKTRDVLSAKALKNTRFALLRNPKRHLSPRDQDAIHRVKSTNRKLARAYELRCDIEDLWDLIEPDDARDFLMNWTRSALLSRREPLRKFARTVRDHLEGILGFFAWHGQTSGLCEGINNKVKLALHKAFGLHSSGAFASMIYLQCGGFDLPLRPPR